MVDIAKAIQFEDDGETYVGIIGSATVYSDGDYVVLQLSERTNLNPKIVGLDFFIHNAGGPKKGTPWQFGKFLPVEEGKETVEIYDGEKLVASAPIVKVP